VSEERHLAVRVRDPGSSQWEWVGHHGQGLTRPVDEAFTYPDDCRRVADEVASLARAHGLIAEVVDLDQATAAGPRGKWRNWRSR